MFIGLLFMQVQELQILGVFGGLLVELLLGVQLLLCWSAFLALNANPRI
jgi:hypothetical protein